MPALGVRGQNLLRHGASIVAEKNKQQQKNSRISNISGGDTCSGDTEAGERDTQYRG